MDNKHFSRIAILYLQMVTHGKCSLDSPKETMTLSSGMCGMEVNTAKHSGFLSQPTHISFQLNTDGVALFKSSKVNFWPVWLVISELPKARMLVIISQSTYYKAFSQLSCEYLLIFDTVY